MSAGSAAYRVAGLGFRAGADVASLHSALQAALAAVAMTEGSAALAALATAEDKAGCPAVVQLAAELVLPVLAVPLAALHDPSATPSTHVPARYGARSLAESAALAAAGAGARLLAPRSVAIDHMATAAIAENTAR